MPVSVSVPEPIWPTAPDPEITPPNVTLSERLKARTPLFTTLPVMDPVVPALPMARADEAPMVVPWV